MTIQEIKTALKISIISEEIDQEISNLVEEAILDLTETADIAKFDLDSADAFQAGAVRAYVAWKWYLNLGILEKAERFHQSFDIYKGQMALSSKYRNHNEEE